MTIDPEVIKAIKDSTKEAGQPETVANRLIAWLEQMSSSELAATDTSEYLDTVRRSINIEAIAGEDYEN